MKSIRLIAAVLITVALGATAQAQKVTNFQSAITVAADSTVKVVERITYDPETPHHGIYRFVPAQFSDSAGQRFFTTIKLESVKDEAGVNYNVAVSHNNSQELYLKIGDPETTFTEPKTYIITYTIKPMAIRAGDHDRLILNITGQQWETIIEKASVAMELPAKVSTAKCYTGASQSTASNCMVQTLDKMVISSTAEPLEMNHGFTIDLTLPPNSFSSYLVPNQRPPLTLQDKLSFGFSAAAGLLLLVALLIELKQQFASWYARRDQVIGAQYEPPEGLLPAEVGTLIKGSQQVENITATIIHLAAKGYIKIELIRPKTWWRQADYSFTKLKDFKGLTSFESSLITPMFQTAANILLKKTATSASVVKLSDLKHNTVMSSVVEGFHKHVGESLTRKGYFHATPNSGYGIILTLTMSGTIVLAAVGLLQDPRKPWFTLAALAVAIVAVLVARKRTGLTKSGLKQWTQVEGFKLFLKMTETDRMKYFNDPKNLPPELTAKFFSDLLPYAIALKVEKQWANQFKGIDVAKAVGAWYIAPVGTNFSASDIGSSFGGAFSSAVSGSFAGSSGSGGAGGGGGGGGGGGW